MTSSAKTGAVATAVCYQHDNQCAWQNRCSDFGISTLEGITVGKTFVFDCRSPDDIPKQLNGCDCGVFALMFAEYQSRDAPFTFDQRHMEYFRVKVLADIMSEHIESPGKC